MKIMISQPMRGKTNEQIREERGKNEFNQLLDYDGVEYARILHEV